MKSGLKRKTVKGFTLVEVTVVLVIVAIIAAIAVPNISGYIEKSKRNNCESIMTGFVNDLEYKVVSKRFYDISDLNSELTSVVLSYGDIKSGPVSNGNEFSVSGVCPNGGDYTFKWQITPENASDEHSVQSARVQLGKGSEANGYFCECSCMGEEEHVKKEGHRFTAALISAVYRETRPPQQLTQNYLTQLIADIEAAAADPGSELSVVTQTAEFTQQFNTTAYAISGMTFNSQSGKVEWISVYQPDVRSENNVIYTVYASRDGNFREYSVPEGEINNLSKLPPAEGTAGSVVYHEGWNTSISYHAADIGQTYSQNVSGENKAVTVKWIQREGNWYVQENSDVSGIDFTPSASENHPLVCAVNDRPAAGSLLTVSAVSDASFDSITRDFTVSATYSNGKTADFGHIAYTRGDDGKVADDYNIKNGFIIVESAESVKNMTWAGIMQDSSAEAADMQRNNLQTLLDKENKLLNDFRNDYSNAKTDSDGKLYNEVTLAYQEYSKYIDASGSYKYEPVTVFRQIRLYKDAELKDVSSITVNNDKAEVSGKIPVTVVGSDGKPEKEILVSGQFEQPLEKPESGSTDIVVNGTVIGSVSVTDVQNSYKVSYTQPADSKEFSAENFTVTKNVKYVVKDNAGKVISTSSEETVSIPLAADGDSTGFYLAVSKVNDDRYKSSTDSTASAVNDCEIFTDNSGAVVTPALYLTSGDKLCDINVAPQGYSWSYDGVSDELFDISHLNVKVDLKLSLTGVSGVSEASVSGSDTLQFRLPHSKSNNKAGYYICTGYTAGSNGWWITGWGKSDRTTYNPENEANAIASLSKGAVNNISVVLNYPVNNDYYNIKIGTVTSTYDSVFAYYTNDTNNPNVFSFEKLHAFADYTIKVQTTDRTPALKAEIKYHKPLSVDVAENAFNRYYISKKYISNTYDNNVKNSHNSFNINSSETQPVTAYVYHKDSEYKYCSVQIDLSGVPDFIFYPVSEGSKEAYIYGYIGTSPDVVVPASETGYWTETDPGNGVSRVKVTPFGDGKEYYYVNDKTRNYSIVRAGGIPSVYPQASPEEGTVKFPPSLEVQKLTLSEGITEVGPYAFRKLNMAEDGSIKIADSVTDIGSYAFYNAGNGKLRNLSIGTVSPSVSEEGRVTSASSSSKLEIIGSYAFSNLNALDKTEVLMIPETVKQIGDSAFDNLTMNSGTFIINGASELRAVSEKKPADNEPASGNQVNAAESDEENKHAVISNRAFGHVSVNSLMIGGSVEVIDDRLFTFEYREGEETKYVSTLNFNNNSSSGLTIGGNVTEIGAYAFAGSNFDDKLIIEGSVSKIRTGAFSDCTVFSGTLSLGNVTDIGADAFRNMINAVNLEIPDAVTHIGTYAFDHFGSAHLSSNEYGTLTVNGGSNGSSLGAGIFTNAHFKNVYIGGNVTKIDARAFKNAPLGGETPYNELKGTLTIADTVTEIGIAAFEGCSGFTGNLVLPENNAFTRISDAAFEGCLGFTGNLEIPANVKTVGSRAFMGCVGFNGALTLNEGLEEIKMEAFRNCTNFTGGLTVPSTVTKGIGNCAFQKFANNVNDQSSLGKLTVKAGSYSSGHSLGAFIFSQAHFKGVEIGGIVDTVDANAFHHQNEKSISIPDDDKVPDYVDETDETVTEMPVKTSSVTADYSGITGTVSLGSGVHTVGVSAFENLTTLSGELDLSSVTSIGDNAFKGCTGFNSGLTLSQNLTLLGDYAFSGCSSITGDLNIPHTLRGIGLRAFENCSGFNGKLVIENTENNGAYTGVTDIKAEAFSGCTHFTGGLTVPESVENIDNLAFRNFAANTAESGELIINGSTYKGINDDGTVSRKIGSQIFTGGQYVNVSIGGTVTDIDDHAFDNAHVDADRKMVYSPDTNSDYSRVSGSLKIADTVKYIGERAFCNTKFDSIELCSVKESSRLNTVGPRAFDHCTEVTNGLYIPQSVTGIGEYAFDSYSSEAGTHGSLQIFGCSGTEKCSDNNETCASKKGYSHEGDEHGYIDRNIFNNSAFNDVMISGNSVHEIKDEAFRFNTRLTGTLTIGGTVETVGYMSFGNCEGFTSLSIDNNHLSRIHEGAFVRCKNIEGGLYIPATVNYIEKSAFKEFASSVEDETKLGELKIYGSSDADGNLGKPLSQGSSDGSPLFGSAKFRNVIIGGNVKRICHNQFDNKRYYDFGSSLMNSSNQVVTNPFGGANDNYKFDEIKGTLTIEEGVTDIEGNAFACMAFSDITIPKTVTSIGETAFMFTGTGNGRLKIYGTSAPDNTLGNGEEIPIFLGAKFNGVTIGGNVKKIEAGFMHNCDGNRKLVQSNGENNVNVEYRYNYTYSDITGPLTIGNSVEEIGQSAFENCNFSGRLILGQKLSDDCPDDTRLRTIGSNAFKDCTQMRDDLIIPHTMKNMGTGAFFRFAADAGYGSYLVLWAGSSNNGNTIDSEVFDGARFTNVTISGNVHIIADNAFNNVNKAADRNYDNVRGSLLLAPGVHTIGNNAFENCKFDGQLTIGDRALVLDRESSYYPDITIGSNAFKDLKDLYSNYTAKDSSGNTVQAEFFIPNTVISVGENAFASMCANVTDSSKIPALKVYGISSGKHDSNNVLVSNNYCFGTTNTWADGKLATIAIFPGAKFRNVTFGGAVKVIPEDAFNNSGGDYSGFTGSLTIEKEVNNIWGRAFKDCSGFDGRLTLGFEYDKPDNNIDDGVQRIGEEAFYGCSGFTGGLTVPASIRQIDSKAFSYFASAAGGTNVGELKINGYSSLKDVAESRFGFEKKNARTIDADLFNHSKFRDVTIGWEVEVIASEFMKSFTKNTTTNGQTVSEVFDYTGITGSLEIGDNVILIEDEAFNAENIAADAGRFDGSITFKTGRNYRKYIGEKAFKRQHFTGDLLLPYTIGYLKEQAFAECTFTGKLQFNYDPDNESQSGWGIDTISTGAFSGCSGFFTDSTEKTLVIPRSVTVLGDNAFYKLAYDISTDYRTYPSVEVRGGTKQSDNSILLEDHVFTFAKIYNITIGGTVTKIDNSFMNNTLTEPLYGEPGNPVTKLYSNIKGKITIEGTVKTIGDSAFKDLQHRGGLDIQNGVTTIGAHAFEGCSVVYGDCGTAPGDRKLYIQSSVTSIGADAFKNFCGGLGTYPELVIHGTSHPNGVLGNGTDAIFNGARFTNVSIGGNVRSIGSHFMHTSLTSYDYREIKGKLILDYGTVQSIGNDAFNGTGITKFVFGYDIYQKIDSSEKTRIFGRTDINLRYNDD